MADHLGFYNTATTRTTVRFAFTTHNAAGATVAPSSAFEAADLLIYKDGSATQRTSANGITMTSPFDSITGLHHVSIDLTDNSDAGFWASGSWYMVVLSPDETVDSQTVAKVLAYFEIGNSPVLTSPDGVETGVSVQGALRAILAVLAGRIADAGTGTETFKNPGGGTTRVTVTVDSQGNRSAVTLNV